MNLDEDVLLAVRELAELRGTTAGQVLSELARSALASIRLQDTERNGVPLLTPTADAGLVTVEAVGRLQD